MLKFLGLGLLTKISVPKACRIFSNHWPYLAPALGQFVGVDYELGNFTILLAEPCTLCLSSLVESLFTCHEMPESRRQDCSEAESSLTVFALFRNTVEGDYITSCPS